MKVKELVSILEKINPEYDVIIRMDVHHGNCDNKMYCTDIIGALYDHANEKTFYICGNKDLNK